ncbi:hypothetical protein IPC613_33010 [Pseudomonas aeruginosa]|nr:hypothetical protein F8133_05135 [Pseudomonas aeruginosa]MBF3110635.1 hypothetical protein [Pseudomonas aeruginosa]MCO2004177.1 hypothetical protein [Pseudomonas aeruginosa]OWJ38040.1 hypothetical protein CDC02_17390 [Pseudomonas aeruginosa]PBZ05463.1 hypothetical protein CJT42_01505 [Pseudomonas aeruginosa]
MPIHRDGVVTDYAARCTDECWQAWKASRAALKVELPEKIGPHNMVGRHVLPEAAGYDDAIDDCREALQQAGIELKP